MKTFTGASINNSLVTAAVNPFLISYSFYYFRKLFFFIPNPSAWLDV